MVYYIVGMSALCLLVLVWLILRKDWSKEIPPPPPPPPERKKRSKRKKPAAVEAVPPHPTLHCQWCGKTLRRTKVNGRRRRSDRKWCSSQCTQKAAHERKKKGLVKPRRKQLPGVVKPKGW